MGLRAAKLGTLPELDQPSTKARYLFIDTSPMWMEKFIATVKLRHALIADAEAGREYGLIDPDDDAALRLLGGFR